MGCPDCLMKKLISNSIPFCLMVLTVFAQGPQPPILRNNFTTNALDLTMDTVIGANNAGGSNFVIIASGDSMADSPGGTRDSAFSIMEPLLFSIYGWAGSGPTETVDTGVGSVILTDTNRVTTNLFNNYSFAIYASDGSANVLSSKTSSNVYNSALTEIGVFYERSPVAGTIRLIHTATGINVTNVVTATSATRSLAYTNFLVTDSLRDHKITFASATLTNNWMGFIMRNSTNRGIEFYYMAKAGGTLSNMLIMGTNSMRIFSDQLKPSIVLYHAKDNESTNLNNVGSYALQLQPILNTLRGGRRVQYISTPQQQANTDNLTQNAFAQLICYTNGWTYVPLSEHFPMWQANTTAGLMEDNTHPNALGCNIWSHFILNFDNVAVDSGTNVTFFGKFGGDPTALIFQNLNVSNAVNIGNTSPVFAFSNSLYADSITVKAHGIFSEWNMGSDADATRLRVNSVGNGLQVKGVSYQLADLSGNTLMQGGSILGVICNYSPIPFYLAAGGVYPANGIVAGGAALWNSNGVAYFFRSTPGGTTWGFTNQISGETNLAPYRIITNDFAFNTFYTNANQRANISFWISAYYSAGYAQAGLFIDQDNNNNYEDRSRLLQTDFAITGTNQQFFSAFLQPNARFVISNLTGSTNIRIVTNNCSWVFQ